MNSCSRCVARIRHIVQRVICALGSLALSTVLSFLVVPVSHAQEQSECQAGVTNYVSEQPWTNKLFQLDTLHTYATGKGVIVAVVDSGVDVNNPHFAGATVDGTSYLPNDPSNGNTDIYNHGTIVAGIIAARPVDGSAVKGLAPDAKIMPIRIFEALREEKGKTVGGPTLETVAQGIRLAVERGAKVINVSLSDTRDIPQMREAVAFAESHGALIVASAGNRLTSSSTVDGKRYPASYREVVGVTALNTDLQPTEDSVHGKQVDVAAPGMNIASAVPSGVDCVFGDTPSSSYATAFVSAQAALIAERYPNETPAQWRQRIFVTANRVHPDERTDLVGWGIMDPITSLTVELSDTLRGPDHAGNQSSGFTQGQSEDTTVILQPLYDPHTHVKYIAGLITIITAVICAVSWLIAVRKR